MLSESPDTTTNIKEIKFMTLPKHLSINFPIWAIHDTPGNGAYHDLDKMVAETAERGFNCIRCEDGAGLIDFSVNPPNGVVPISEPYPGFTSTIRQSWCVGNGGPCNLLQRLLDLCKAAKKYNVYLILSSWYYLHTYWYCGDEELNKRLHEIPPHDRFQYFAEQLNFILDVIRKNGYIDRIVSAEILNEADGLNFCGGYAKGSPENAEMRLQFRDDHERALAWLIERNPDVRFAYDTCSPDTDLNLFPRNAQVWTFHSYYLWHIYHVTLENGLCARNADVNNPEINHVALSYFKENFTPFETVLNCRGDRFPSSEGGWFRRIWLYSNLDPNKLGDLEQKMERYFAENFDMYKQRIDKALDTAVAVRDKVLPGAPLLMGEGCSYIGSNFLQWEEKSERYWQLVEYAARQSRKHNIWGSVIRTCSGCEDPSWNLCKENYQKVNAILTEGN